MEFRDCTTALPPSPPTSRLALDLCISNNTYTELD